jgi:hypothetical protein
MPIWTQVIGLGNPSLVFPLAIIIALVAMYRRDYARAAMWLSSFGAGVMFIVVAKFAFDFGGYAWPAVGFYSISGHAMLTSALYPVLLGMLIHQENVKLHRLAVGSGVALAVIMAVVLVAGRYHTMAETLGGVLIGLTVALINVSRFTPLRWVPMCAVVIATIAMELTWPANSIHTAEHGLWSRAGQLFGVSGRYVRLIHRDPNTGRTIIIVKPPRPIAMFGLVHIR